VVECTLSMCGVLGSMPRTAKQKQKQNPQFSFSSITSEVVNNNKWNLYTIVVSYLLGFYFPQYLKHFV
jgi:hypothetical protein